MCAEGRVDLWSLTVAVGGLEKKAPSVLNLVMLGSWSCWARSFGRLDHLLVGASFSLVLWALGLLIDSCGTRLAPSARFLTRLMSPTLAPA